MPADGAVAESVLEAPCQKRADLLVVRADKRPAADRGKHLLNGRVAREAGCDVMIVRTNG